MALINLKELSLDYFHYLRKDSLKKTLLKPALKFLKIKEETFQLKRALDGLDLTIESGDRIGLIGKNGSGKSTLLKLISGIYEPTYGKMEIEGSITSILNIGVGMNEDATGYENIILVGLLNGKKRKQMKAQFKEIEEFTELKDYLKMPVRTYSSGMRLRLAFAIATSIESDILAIDEVIGVGDHKFMEKAQKRLLHLISKSQILVLASHATGVIENFCNKVLVLDQGKCVFFGALQEGINFYHSLS